MDKAAVVILAAAVAALPAADMAAEMALYLLD